MLTGRSNVRPVWHYPGMPLGTPIADRECTICNRYIAPAVDDLENHQARGCRLRNRTQQRLKPRT